MESDKMKKDPYLIFGLGMINYREMMRMFLYLFILFTVLATPIICIYKNGGTNNNGALTGLAKYSIANLGFESS